MLLSSAGTLAFGSRRIAAEEAAFTGPAATNCVPSSLDRSDRAAGHEHRGLAAAGLARRLAAHPDQPARRPLLAALESQRQRLAHRRALRAPARLLAGRRRELRPRPPLPARRDRDGARHAEDRQGLRSRSRSTSRSRYPTRCATTPPANNPTGSASEVQHFHSAAQPAAARDRRSRPKAPPESPGDIFAAPYSGPGQDGPMIFDGSGQLVWFQSAPHGHPRRPTCRCSSTKASRS